MDEKLKIGDVVQLNSGSPNMVITYITEPDDDLNDPTFCDCTCYFEGEYQYLEGMDSRTLTKIKV
jgi:uncharacterized protein YodC (DUF2158 family)